MGAVFLETILNNHSPKGLKIFSLSNVARNSAVLIAVCAAACNARIRIASASVLMAPCLLGRDEITPALSNTLFMIHPVVLYAAAAAAATQQAKRSLRSLPVVCMGLAMFLGGFWSTQELSWGGWWNWDVLECGVAYYWILSVRGSHSGLSGSMAFRATRSCCLSWTAVSYTLLNKYGLGVSIHSFVSSKSLRVNYCAVALWAASAMFALASRRLSVAYFYAALLVALYSILRSCVFLKGPSVLVVFMLSLRLPRALRPYHAIQHWLVGFFLAVLAYANLVNVSMYFAHVGRDQVTWVLGAGRLHGVRVSADESTRLVWRGMWLSKPRYTLGLALDSSNVRSLAERRVTFSFLK